MYPRKPTGHVLCSQLRALSMVCYYGTGQSSATHRLNSPRSSAEKDLQKALRRPSSPRSIPSGRAIPYQPKSAPPSPAGCARGSTSRPPEGSPPSAARRHAAGRPADGFDDIPANDNRANFCSVLACEPGQAVQPQAVHFRSQFALRHAKIRGLSNAQQQRCLARPLSVGDCALLRPGALLSMNMSTTASPTVFPNVQAPWFHLAAVGHRSAHRESIGM